MKKQVKIILILLCLLTVLSVAALAACKPDEPQSNEITITVNVNLDGFAEQTFTVDKNAEFYSRLNNYLPQEHDGLTFAGWVDSTGAGIDAATRWEKSGKVTAQWSAAYVVEYYLETDDGFVKSDGLTANKVGLVGANVVAEQITIEGYVYDANNSNNVATAKLSSNTVLKLYYKRATFTITFHKNNDAAYGEMGVQTCYYGVPVNIMSCGFTWRHEDRSDFGGWNTEADGSGDYWYSDGAQETLTTNLDLYAQWLTSYTEQIYVERLVDGEYVYQPLYDTPKTVVGYLNNSVSMTNVFDEEHYFLDYDHADNKSGTASLQENDELVAYYSIERLFVTYADSNKADEVRYNGRYVVRTPEDDPNSADVVIKYGTSLEGDGSAYGFGDVIEAVSSNLTLYPIYADVCLDVNGSADKLVLLPASFGAGAVRLVKDGVGYVGTVSEADGDVLFVVTVDGTAIHGKLTEDGKFVYRNELQVGTYLARDLFDDTVQYSATLVLDGYGNASYRADGGNAQAVLVGTYTGLDNYVESYREFEFVAEGSNADDNFKFILFEHKDDGGTVTLCFMQRRAEEGVYKTDGADFPRLELDGYRSARYVESANGSELYGSYTVVNSDGTYVATVTLNGEEIETIQVVLDLHNKTFSLIS